MCQLTRTGAAGVSITIQGGWRAEWIADQVRNDTIELYRVNTEIEEHSGKFLNFACSDMAQSIGITDCDTVCEAGMTYHIWLPD